MLGLFIFALFPVMFFEAPTFNFLDFGLQVNPFAFYHREAFWREEIPLSNPLTDCGIPFLAQ